MSRRWVDEERRKGFLGRRRVYTYVNFLLRCNTYVRKAIGVGNVIGIKEEEENCY